MTWSHLAPGRLGSAVFIPEGHVLTFGISIGRWGETVLGILLLLYSKHKGSAGLWRAVASGRSWADRPLDTTPRVCRPLDLFAAVSYIDSETLRLEVLEDTCSHFKPRADFGGPSQAAPLLFEQTRRHASFPSKAVLISLT